MNILSSPDLLNFSIRNRTTAQIRARMETVATEAVTGLKSDVKLATQGQLGDAHLMRKALMDLDQATRINALTGTRLDLISGAVTGSREAIGGLDTEAIVALRSGGDIGIQTVISDARSALASVMSSLSVKQGSRSLLSGNFSDRAPFAATDALLEDVQNILATVTSVTDAEAALDFYFNDPAGGFATQIYQGGDDFPPPLQIGNNAVVPLQIKGDAQGFKDIMRGLATLGAAQSFAGGNDPASFEALFEAGSSILATGVSALITLEGEIGVHQESLARASDRFSAEAVVLNSSFQKLLGRDQFEASAELKQLEVQLTASYTLTARLSELTLTNFLR